MANQPAKEKPTITMFLSGPWDGVVPARRVLTYRARRLISALTIPRILEMIFAQSIVLRSILAKLRRLQWLYSGRELTDQGTRSPAPIKVILNPKSEARFDRAECVGLLCRSIVSAFSGMGSRAGPQLDQPPSALLAFREAISEVWRWDKVIR